MLVCGKTPFLLPETPCLFFLSVTIAISLNKTDVKLYPLTGKTRCESGRVLMKDFSKKATCM